MKTEQYKELEQKYFEGKTTPEEEKRLKETDEVGLFKTLKDEKSETMDWDFDDFLKKADVSKIIPLQKKTSFKISKIFWMAASVVLLFGLYFGYQNFTQNMIAEHNDQISEQIKNQKRDFNNENSVAANDEVNDSLKNDSDSAATEKPISKDEERAANETVDKILSKKGRIKKKTRQKYTYNETNYKHKTTAVPEYQDNYVMINGHKIKDEEEAIDVAKYSFQILSEKVNKTIASTVIQENPADD